jgi:hypothetical protein
MIVTFMAITTDLKDCLTALNLSAFILRQKIIAEECEASDNRAKPIGSKATIIGS